MVCWWVSRACPRRYTRVAKIALAHWPIFCSLECVAQILSNSVLYTIYFSINKTIGKLIFENIIFGQMRVYLNLLICKCARFRPHDWRSLLFAHVLQPFFFFLLCGLIVRSLEVRWLERFREIVIFLKILTFETNFDDGFCFVCFRPGPSDLQDPLWVKMSTITGNITKKRKKSDAKPQSQMWVYSFFVIIIMFL